MHSSRRYESSPEKLRVERAIWINLALLAITAAAFVALPQISSTRAGGVTRAPLGRLFIVNTLDDHNDFVCDNNDCTLAEAIDASNNAPTADTISFSVTGTINLTTPLSAITDSVTIQGPGADMLTLSPNTSFRILNVTTTGTVAISGLTLTHGRFFSGSGGAILNGATGTLAVNNCTLAVNGAGFGGGIANAGAGTVTVNNCMMMHNSANAYGGAIFNDNGTVTVTNTAFSDCQASIGGGAVFNSSGLVNFTNCTLSSNLALNGGGIYIFGSVRGMVNVTNCTISDNLGDFGGGVSAFNGTVNITNSTLSGNRASTGGAILNNSQVTVTNTTISGNSSTGYGGGVLVVNRGTLNVSNSTLSSNSAGGNGGGVAIDDSDPSGTPGAAVVKSSIIAANTGFTGNDVYGAFTSQGFNLISRTDFSTGFTQPTDLTGTNGIPLNAGLDPNGLQDNGGPTKTIALLCGSPAIDKGTSDGLTGALKTDQRSNGFPRTNDDNLIPNAADGTDIGAFELSAQTCNHPPVAQCQNIQVSAGVNCQASITASQVDNGSFDPDAGDSIASRTLDTSGPFALGPHTVMLTVTDTHGASSSCSATVTVVDTTPPALTCPPNPNVPAAPGQCQAVVNYPNPTVTDNCPGAMLLGCAPSPGSTFQVGSTPVTCTAKDAAGNNGACQFQVIVFDNQPPLITCPANVTALTDQTACPNPACKVVSYPAPVASDNCPGVTAVCTPPAGSCFPTGAATVTCTATDTAGNTATCSFTVTVFDTALQDDSNPSTILLWNSITGSYRFCCIGVTLTGVGKCKIQGCVYTLQHNPSDRRVLGRVDKSVHSGSGSIQAPPGTIRCTVTDRNTLNDTNLTSCQ